MPGGLEVRPRVFAGHRSEDLSDELLALLSVRHDDDALVCIAICLQHGNEPHIHAEVIESRCSAWLLYLEAKSPVVFLPAQHLMCHRLREDFVGAAGVSVLHFDGCKREIGRCRPQAARGHLWNNMKAAGHRFAVSLVSMSRPIAETRRQRLFVGAVRHADRPKHEIVHESGEAFAGSIHHHQLHDHDAAAGVTVNRSWKGRDLNGWRECRPGSAQNLDDGWDWLGRLIAAESVDIRSCRVTEKSAQGDLLILREFILRKLPGDELIIDVLIELEFALLDERESAQSGDRFTDRAGLEKSLGRDGASRLHIGHSIDACPCDATMVKEGDADTGYVIELHPVRELHCGNRLAFDHDRGQETAFNACDSRWSVTRRWELLCPGQRQGDYGERRQWDQAFSARQEVVPHKALL